MLVRLGLLMWQSFSPLFFFSFTPQTIAHQAPPSMEFSRQEYWSGLPFPSPGHLPDPGIKPRSPALQADALPSEPPKKPFSPLLKMLCICFQYTGKNIFFVHLCMLGRTQNSHFLSSMYLIYDSLFEIRFFKATTGLFSLVQITLCGYIDFSKYYQVK